MGASISKKPFSEWELIQFSNLTGEYPTILVFTKRFFYKFIGIPPSLVAEIYKDFITATGNDNKMDKDEFRRLLRKMYVDSQPTSLPSGLPSFFTKHDLNKMADQVFETYDFEGTGMTFIVSH